MTDEGGGLIRGIEFSNASGAGRSVGGGFGDNCAAFCFLIFGLSGGFADEDGGLIRGIEFRNAPGSLGGEFGDNGAAFGFLGIEFGRVRT